MQSHQGAHKWRGWIMYVWLVYLVFFVAPPIFEHAAWKTRLYTGLGVAAFLVFYFGYFYARQSWRYACVAGIVVLGILFAPSNNGAAAFFIYSASFVPFLVEGELRAALLIGGVVAIAALESWLLHISNGFTFPAVFLSTFIGAGNIYFAQRARHAEIMRKAHEELEHMAKVAERERIARDLHDVLGHTLSLIALKSELAGKLIDRDPSQAKVEIRDVEVASRHALAEVRQAILGYRAQGLAYEFKQARSTLETAGVRVSAQVAEIPLPATHDTVLSLALREAVTNIVRHARAQHCWMSLTRQNGKSYLEVRDDGRGGQQVEGNGLRGMRERVEALGGQVERDTREGTRIRIALPVG
jgi:two-component system sensor histidine kinase DesK